MPSAKKIIKESDFAELPPEHRDFKHKVIDKGCTREEEVFCLEYVKHGNIAQAYRVAKPGVVHGSYAGAWIRRKRIQYRITELRKLMRDLSVISLKTHLKDLAEIRDAARGDGKYAAAVSAEIARGRAAGLYNHAKTTKHMFPQLSNMSSADIAKQLQDLESTNTKFLEHHPDGTVDLENSEFEEFEGDREEEAVTEGASEEETSG